MILPAGYDDRPTAATRSSTSCTASRELDRLSRQRLARRRAARTAGPAILVFPQGARDDDTDPEYLDWGAGRNWETYIADGAAALDRRALPHDPLALRPRDRRPLGRRLRRDDRSACTTPARFSVIESWSGYFHPTDPTGTQPLDRGPAANATPARR